MISACLPRQGVPAQATVLGWADGALTLRQADRAVEVLTAAGHVPGGIGPNDDPRVVRSGLVREVVTAALGELPDGEPPGKGQADLLQVALRLARPGQDEDPVIRRAVDRPGPGQRRDRAPDHGPEAELASAPPTAKDDLLRLHGALASDYNDR